MSVFWVRGVIQSTAIVWEGGLIRIFFLSDITHPSTYDTRAPEISRQHFRSVAKYKEFWPDVTHPSSMNLDRFLSRCLDS